MVSWAAEAADSWFFVLASIVLARVVCLRERPSEGLAILDEAARHPQSPDLEVVVNSRSVRAMALARLGRLEEAEALAREAVGLAAPTNFLRFHADALVVLADVLSRSGRPDRGRHDARGGPHPLPAQGQPRLRRRTPGPCSSDSDEPDPDSRSGGPETDQPELPGRALASQPTSALGERVCENTRPGPVNSKTKPSPVVTDWIVRPSTARRRM